MPIYYCSISRGKIVVCYHSTVRLQLEELSARALDQLGPSDKQRCQRFNQNLIYTYVNDGLTYLCITNDQFPQGDAFKFLKEVAKVFRRDGHHLKAKSCGLYALRSDFEETLIQLMDEHSGDLSGVIKTRVHSIQNSMRENLDKLTERGDSLDDLEERSEYLKQNSTEFQRTATKLRRKMLWKSFKLWSVLIIILLIIIAIIVVLIVLGATKKL